VIIVDRTLARLAAEDDPIRVGMIGAGFMGQGIARQLLRYVQGMKLVAVSNRHPERAERAYRDCGVDSPRSVATPAELEEAIDAGVPAVTDDPTVVCRAGSVDVVLEVTGDIGFGADVAVDAIDHGKHFVTMSAELDGTVGPILNRRAERAGVVFTQSDGDQPGVLMNLYRFVRGIGVSPVLCGNIKGFHDPHRNPTTQKPFADKVGESPEMITSFTDGTKISFEQATVANATAMGVACRGMLGPQVPAGTPVEEAPLWYPDEVLAGDRGVVDYVVGAVPAPGVFVLGRMEDPVQQHYLKVYKLGKGPVYVFYRPYHLCHFEAHNAVVRATVFGDATLASRNGPSVEVVATAKVDLEPGDRLDGPGGYKTYGQCEAAAVVADEDLLVMGISEQARVVRPVAKDEVITRRDVELLGDRMVDRLRAEQDRAFGGAARGEPAAVQRSSRSRAS
jgi:predicted homoserine dehydrogenase-like protein